MKIVVKDKCNVKPLPNYLRRQGLKGREFWRHRELYLFLLPSLAAVLIFNYIPMYGVLMAFQKVRIGDTFGMSEWIGFDNFIRFFHSPWFPVTIKNTVCLALLDNVLLWPCPLILAVLLYNCKNQFIRKFTQNGTYLPYLLSIVVIVSILNVFCSGESGIINILLGKFGFNRISFFGDPDWVYPLYCISSVWQSAGYGAIIYLGALSTVDEQTMEAARVDGAGKLRCILSIQLPTIMPTVIVMLILSLGNVFAIGADKALLLQTDLNLMSSEVISTYVYKAGVLQAQYGFSTAIGLFQNVINLMMLLIVNTVAKKVTDTSIL